MKSELHSAGVMLVLSSPSGAGKTTISNLLVDKKENNLVRAISMTTRQPRPEEIDGKDYFFVKEKEFLELCKKGYMLEYAKVFEHYYGVPRIAINQNLTKGISVLFNIDWQGAFRLMQDMKSHVVSVFILPPSMEELEKRLKKREANNHDMIRGRLDKASFEISHCYDYDYVIVNKYVEESVERISGILKAEKLKIKRQLNLDQFVKDMFTERNYNI